MNGVAITVAELAEELKKRKHNNQKTTLILGSRTGDLFRSQYLYTWLERYSARNFAEMSPRERFSECYKLLEGKRIEEGTSPRDVKASLTYALGDVGFSGAMFCVAELAQQGIFKVILDNNIDDRLFNAFESSGMKLQHDFIAPHLERSSMSRVEEYKEYAGRIEKDKEYQIVHHDKLDVCKLVKIYADIDAFVNDLWEQDGWKECNRQVKSLLTELRTKAVLVVGLDPFWDASLMSALPRQVETVWFVNEDDAVLNAFLDQTQAEQFNFIVGEKGEYEEFIKALHYHISGGVPRDYEFKREILTRLQDMRHELEKLNTGFQGLRSEVETMRRLIDAIHRKLDDGKKT